MRGIFVVAFLAAAVACGGKTPAPAHHGDHDGPGSGAGSATGPLAGHEGEHDDMSPELQKFHDVFAPRWHADKGAKRTADTCGAVPEFKTAADGIATATPPATTNADTWTTGTRALVAAITKLGDACKANDATKFEAAFTDVHEAFHSLMSQAGMHKPGAGQHEGHEMGHGDGKGGGDGKGSAGHDHH
jgi:hypothetical protein